MKNSLTGMGLLAAVCLVCAPGFAVLGVPHPPLAGSTSCANYSAGTWNALSTPYGAPATSSVAGSIPIFALTPGLDNPVTSWPAAGKWDFCAAFDSTACSFGPLSALTPSLIIYAALFQCSADLNGPISTDPGLSMPLTANGIPDGEFELGLLAAILNNSYALDPTKTGGVTNDQILAAFKSNYNYFRVLVTTAFANVPLKVDMRSLIPGLCGPYLHTGMAMVFAGYATEGDAQSMAALNLRISELGGLGFQLPAGGVEANTTGFASILGPDGDADGDGYTNRAEYNYFKTQGAAVTIAAQLNAAVTPPLPPITGSIVINGNLSATNSQKVTLALTWSGGAGVVRMRFSDDGATWSPWEFERATRAYTLPVGDGYKTARVQYLDGLNTRSAVFSDFIRLDTAPPAGGITINNGAAVTASQAVTLSLNWSDGTGSGVSRMRFSDNGSTWTVWAPLAATYAHTLPLPNGYHTVRVQYRDAVGNYSAVFSDYINLQMP